MKTRILCLWFLNWPVQHCIADQPGFASRYLLLTESVRGRDLVQFCSERAWNVGVRIGMPLAEARSYCPSSLTVVKPLDRDHHRNGLSEWAIWCERYSPLVGLEDADVPECLLMDVAGLDHLFAGEQSLAEVLVRDMTTQGFTTRAAVARTTGMAWAAARFLTESKSAVVIPDGQADTLFSLPIEALRLSPAQSQRLRKLGLKTVRQILERDRSALKVRFKTDLLKRLDEFTGDHYELIVPCRPAVMFRVQRQWESGIADFGTIERTGNEMLGRLAEQLQERHLGTRCLTCCLTTDDRRQHVMTVQLRDASADSRQLQELLRLKWDGVSLESPLVKIELDALETSPLKWVEMRLFADDSRQNAQQLSALLNRLSNRLGDDAVVYAPAGFDPVPERAIVSQAITTALGNFPPGAEQWLNPWDRPPCVFSRPQPIEMPTVAGDGSPECLFWNNERRRVAFCVGPERIESGWWQGEAVRRDYFRVTLESGERLWVFCRVSDRCWFLHGVWF